MDKRLRELERAVASGDADAKKRLWQERMRLGSYYPVMFTFLKEKRGYGDSVTNGRIFDGYNHSAYLHTAGLLLGSCGPILPVDGILRSISVSVNRPAGCNYIIEVGSADWDAGQAALPGQGKIYSKALLKAGYAASTDRELYDDIPALTALGVRIGGDQSSTFSAICVNLEIWIPG